MIFWSDATDRESPVPSEAINISHLPTRSGRGSRGALGRRAPCHQARVCKSQVATVLLLGFGDGQGGLAPKTTLSGVDGGCGGRWLEDHWTEQRICQNKVIASGQNSRRVHSSAAVRLWPHLRAHTPASPREGGMEGGPGSSTRGHAPVPPRPTGAYMACMDIVSHANPAHQAGILTPCLVLLREPRQGHTHSYSCFYVTRPHTTIPKANNQQKVSDYYVQVPAPLRF